MWGVKLRESHFDDVELRGVFIKMWVVKLGESYFNDVLNLEEFSLKCWL